MNLMKIVLLFFLIGTIFATGAVKRAVFAEEVSLEIEYFGTCEYFVQHDLNSTRASTFLNNTCLPISTNPPNDDFGDLSVDYHCTNLYGGRSLIKFVEIYEVHNTSITNFAVSFIPSKPFRAYVSNEETEYVRRPNCRLEEDYCNLGYFTVTGCWDNQVARAYGSGPVLNRDRVYILPPGFVANTCNSNGTVCCPYIGVNGTCPNVAPTDLNRIPHGFQQQQSYEPPQAPAQQSYQPPQPLAQQSYEPPQPPAQQSYQQPQAPAQSYQQAPAQQSYEPPQPLAQQSYQQPPAQQSYEPPQPPAQQSYQQPQAPAQQSPHIQVHTPAHQVDNDSDEYSYGYSAQLYQNQPPQTQSYQPPQPQAPQPSYPTQQPPQDDDYDYDEYSSHPATNQQHPVVTQNDEEYGAPKQSHQKPSHHNEDDDNDDDDDDDDDEEERRPHQSQHQNKKEEKKKN